MSEMNTRYYPAMRCELCGKVFPYVKHKYSARTMSAAASTIPLYIKDFATKVHCVHHCGDDRLGCTKLVGYIPVTTDKSSTLEGEYHDLDY